MVFKNSMMRMIYCIEEKIMKKDSISVEIALKALSDDEIKNIASKLCHDIYRLIFKKIDL